MQKYNLDPIVVVVTNSHGGCASSGQMIFGILKSAASPIYTVAEQFAWSAAFYIFLAGEKRIMFTNARVGPHSVTVTHYNDTARDINEQYRDILYTSRFNEKIFATIKSVLKMPPRAITEMCVAKKVFSAREARKMGIATHIASGKVFYKTRCTSKNKQRSFKVKI